MPEPPQETPENMPGNGSNFALGEVSGEGVYPESSGVRARCRAICGALIKGGTAVCRRPVANEGDRCILHDGTYLGPGIATPANGRYSRVLPKHLRQRYRKALADPDLLSVADEVAVIQL